MLSLWELFLALIAHLAIQPVPVIRLISSSEQKLESEINGESVITNSNLLTMAN